MTLFQRLYPELRTMDDVDLIDTSIRERAYRERAYVAGKGDPFQSIYRKAIDAELLDRGLLVAER